jgi:hypothetical protein
VYLSYIVGLERTSSLAYICSVGIATILVCVFVNSGGICKGLLLLLLLILVIHRRKR